MKKRNQSLYLHFLVLISQTVHAVNEQTNSNTEKTRQAVDTAKKQQMTEEEKKIEAIIKAQLKNFQKQRKDLIDYGTKNIKNFFIDDQSYITAYLQINKASDDKIVLEQLGSNIGSIFKKFEAGERDDESLKKILTDTLKLQDLTKLSPKNTVSKDTKDKLKDKPTFLSNEFLQDVKSALERLKASGYSVKTASAAGPNKEKTKQELTLERLKSEQESNRENVIEIVKNILNQKLALCYADAECIKQVRKDTQNDFTNPNGTFQKLGLPKEKLQALFIETWPGEKVKMEKKVSEILAENNQSISKKLGSILFLQDMMPIFVQYQAPMQEKIKQLKKEFKTDLAEKLQTFETQLSSPNLKDLADKKAAEKAAKKEQFDKIFNEIVPDAQDVYGLQEPEDLKKRSVEMVRDLIKSAKPKKATTKADPKTKLKNTDKDKNSDVSNDSLASLTNPSFAKFLAIKNEKLNNPMPKASSPKMQDNVSKQQPQTPSTDDESSNIGDSLETEAFDDLLLDREAFQRHFKAFLDQVSSTPVKEDLSTIKFDKDVLNLSLPKEKLEAINKKKEEIEAQIHKVEEMIQKQIEEMNYISGYAKKFQKEALNLLDEGISFTEMQEVLKALVTPSMQDAEPAWEIADEIEDILNQESREFSNLEGKELAVKILDISEKDLKTMVKPLEAQNLLLKKRVKNLIEHSQKLAKSEPRLIEFFETNRNVSDLEALKSLLTPELTEKIEQLFEIKAANKAAYDQHHSTYQAISFKNTDTNAAKVNKAFDHFFNNAERLKELNSLEDEKSKKIKELREKLTALRGKKNEKNLNNDILQIIINNKSDQQKEDAIKGLKYTDKKSQELINLLTASSSKDKKEIKIKELQENDRKLKAEIELTEELSKIKSLEAVQTLREKIKSDDASSKQVLDFFELYFTKKQTIEAIVNLEKDLKNEINNIMNNADSFSDKKEQIATLKEKYTDEQFVGIFDFFESYFNYESIKQNLGIQLKNVSKDFAELFKQKPEEKSEAIETTILTLFKDQTVKTPTDLLLRLLNITSEEAIRQINQEHKDAEQQSFYTIVDQDQKLTNLQKLLLKTAIPDTQKSIDLDRALEAAPKIWGKWLIQEVTEIIQRKSDAFLNGAVLERLQESELALDDLYLQKLRSIVAKTGTEFSTGTSLFDIAKLFSPYELLKIQSVLERLQEKKNAGLLKLSADEEDVFPLIQEHFKKLFFWKENQQVEELSDLYNQAKIDALRKQQVGSFKKEIQDYVFLKEKEQYLKQHKAKQNAANDKAYDKLIEKLDKVLYELSGVFQKHVQRLIDQYSAPSATISEEERKAAFQFFQVMQENKVTSAEQNEKISKIVREHKAFREEKKVEISQAATEWLDPTAPLIFKKLLTAKAHWAKLSREIQSLDHKEELETELKVWLQSMALRVAKHLQDLKNKYPFLKEEDWLPEVENVDAEELKEAQKMIVMLKDFQKKGVDLTSQDLNLDALNQKITEFKAENQELIAFSEIEDFFKPTSSLKNYAGFKSLAYDNQAPEKLKESAVLFLSKLLYRAESLSLKNNLNPSANQILKSRIEQLKVLIGLFLWKKIKNHPGEEYLAVPVVGIGSLSEKLAYEYIETYLESEASSELPEVVEKNKKFFEEIKKKYFGRSEEKELILHINSVVTKEMKEIDALLAKEESHNPKKVEKIRKEYDEKQKLLQKMIQSSEELSAQNIVEEAEKYFIKLRENFEGALIAMRIALASLDQKQSPMDAATVLGVDPEILRLQTEEDQRQLEDLAKALRIYHKITNSGLTFFPWTWNRVLSLTEKVSQALANYE